MKLTILHLGTLGFDANSIVAGTVVAKHSDPNPQTYLVDIPVWAALIQTGEHNVIFDLGCRPDAMEAWPEAVRENNPHRYESDQTMEAQLAKCGLAPADIDTVVVSHMHNDHFGNIRLFGHCDVYVPREDYVFGLIDTHATPRNVGHYDKELFDFPVKQYHPIAVGEDFELLPGIEVITLPGHADNLLGLVVRLDDEGTIILPSDAVYTPENYGPPAKPSGVVVDSVAFFRSIEKVRRIQKRTGGKILYPHYYPEFNEYKKAPEFYS